MKEKHPSLLKYLFSIEMWERFGFYLMAGILVLFLTDQKGFSLDEGLAGEIYSTWMALCYITPVFGGMLAERVLGFRRTILLGAILMMTGYFMLASTEPIVFYLGLAVIALGNGGFKPNISSVLGKLYTEDSKLIDSGYNIFYMGINIGGFICNFVAAYARHNYGWGTAFALAGAGLVIAVLVLLLIMKKLKKIDDAVLAANRAKRRSADEIGFGYMAKWVIPPMIIFGVAGYLLFGLTWGFLLACAPIIFFYVMLWAKASREEKGPLGALLILLFVAMPYFTIYGMTATTMTFWARDYTDRDVQHPAVEWTLDTFRFAEKVGPETDYFKNVDGDAGQKLPEQGEQAKLISTELFQSINPIFIVFFTPLVLFILAALRRLGVNISTPAKVGVGLLLAAASMIVMVFAVKASDHGDDGLLKISAWWLVVAIGVGTVAELFVSPVGLSLVKKIAPPRLTAMMMGAYFIISIAIGIKLAGFAASLWGKVPHDSLFLGLAIFATLFAVLVFSLTPWLNKYMPKEKTE